MLSTAMLPHVRGSRGRFPSQWARAYACGCRRSLQDDQAVIVMRCKQHGTWSSQANLKLEVGAAQAPVPALARVYNAGLTATVLQLTFCRPTRPREYGLHTPPNNTNFQEDLQDSLSSRGMTPVAGTSDRPGHQPRLLRPFAILLPDRPPLASSITVVGKLHASHSRQLSGVLSRS